MRGLLKAAAALCCAVILAGCGGGGGGGSGRDTEPTSFAGTVVDTAGKPIANLQAVVYETYERALTDEDGAFSITSYKHLDSASFFFQTSETSYSLTADIGAIPADALLVTVRFTLDQGSRQLTLTQLEFDTAAPPTDGPTPEPTPGTPQPGQSPTPSPTPKPGNFDGNGNTTAFGIPKGLSGNVSAGKVVWAKTCVSCHAAEKMHRSYGQTKGSTKFVPTMVTLGLTNKQIADVTAYLNRDRK